MDRVVRFACHASIVASIIIASLMLLLTLSAIEGQAELPLDLLPDVVFARMTSAAAKPVDGASTTDRIATAFRIEAVAEANPSRQ